MDKLAFEIGADGSKAISEFKKVADSAKKNLGEGSTSAQDFAQGIRDMANEVESHAKYAAQAVEILGDALGPELSAKVGQGGIDRLVSDMERAGVSIEDVRANADDVADALRRMTSVAEAASPAVQHVAQSADQVQTSLTHVRGEADKTGSVMANTVGNAAQSMADSFGVAGVAGGTLGVTIGQLAEYAAEGGVSLGELAKFAGPMIVVTAAVAGVGKVLSDRKREAEEFAHAISATRDALADLGDVAPRTLFLKQALEALNDPANAANDELKELAEKARAAGVSTSSLAVSISGGMSAFKAWLQSQADAAGLSDQMTALLDDQKSSQVNLTGATQDQVDTWGHLIDIYAQGDDVIRANQKALEENRTSVEYLLSSAQALGAFLQSVNPGSIKDLVDPEILRELKTELDAGGTGAQTFTQHAAELNTVIGERGPAAFLELIRATKETEDSISSLTTTYEELTGALDKRESYLNLLDTLDGVKQAATDAFAAASSGATDAESKARDYEQASLNAQTQLLTWLQSLGSVPPQVATQIQALIDNGSFDEAERRLALLERTRQVSVMVSTGKTSASSYLDPRYLPHGATGGIVTQPTMALIGEAGPEAVVPLSGTPGSSPLPGLGGGGNTYNITVQGLTGPQVADDIVAKIIEFERRNGSGWRS